MFVDILETPCPEEGKRSDGANQQQGLPDSLQERRPKNRKSRRELFERERTARRLDY